MRTLAMLVFFSVLKEKNMNIKITEKTLEQFISAIDQNEYFYDDLDLVMMTYRFHPTLGLQVFGPEPTILQVAGPNVKEQDQELLNFYGSISNLVLDVMENGGIYDKWCSSFNELTYRDFVKQLRDANYLSETVISELEADVEEGKFVRVCDFIDRVNLEIEQHHSVTVLLTA